MSASADWVADSSWEADLTAAIAQSIVDYSGTITRSSAEFDQPARPKRKPIVYDEIPQKNNMDWFRVEDVPDDERPLLCFVVTEWGKGIEEGYCFDKSKGEYGFYVENMECDDALDYRVIAWSPMPKLPEWFENES